MSITQEQLKGRLDRYFEHIKATPPFSGATEKDFIENLSRIFLYRELGLIEQYPDKTDEEYKALLSEKQALLADSYIVTRMVFSVLPSIISPEKQEVTDEELEELKNKFQTESDDYEKKLTEKKLTHFGGLSSDEFVNSYFTAPSELKPEEAEFHFLTYNAFYAKLKLDFVKFIINS